MSTRKTAARKNGQESGNSRLPPENSPFEGKTTVQLPKSENQPGKAKKARQQRSSTGWIRIPKSSGKNRGNSARRACAQPHTGKPSLADILKGSGKKKTPGFGRKSAPARDRPTSAGQKRPKPAPCAGDDPATVTGNARKRRVDEIVARLYAKAATKAAASTKADRAKAEGDAPLSPRSKRKQAEILEELEYQLEDMREARLEKSRKEEEARKAKEFYMKHATRADIIFGREPIGDEPIESTGPVVIDMCDVSSEEEEGCGDGVANPKRRAEETDFALTAEDEEMLGNVEQNAYEVAGTMHNAYAASGRFQDMMEDDRADAL